MSDEEKVEIEVHLGEGSTPIPKGDPKDWVVQMNPMPAPPNHAAFSAANGQVVFTVGSSYGNNWTSSLLGQPMNPQVSDALTVTINGLKYKIVLQPA